MWLHGCFPYEVHQNLSEWLTIEFESHHNHELANVSVVQFLRSHRKVGESDKAQVQVLLSFEVKTSQIMDHLVLLSGGYKNVGFTKKDLYNHIDMDRKSKICHGDAEGVLEYLGVKKEMDLSFFMIALLSMKANWRIYSR